MEEQTEDKIISELEAEKSALAGLRNLESLISSELPQMPAKRQLIVQIEAAENKIYALCKKLESIRLSKANRSYLDLEGSRPRRRISRVLTEKTPSMDLTIKNPSGLALFKRKSHFRAESAGNLQIASSETPFSRGIGPLLVEVMQVLSDLTLSAQLKLDSLGNLMAVIQSSINLENFCSLETLLKAYSLLT
jgi:hypothetical protein